MDTYEEERTPQEAAEGRRSLNVGKAVSDARKIKFDRMRVLDYRTSSIIQMERMLHRKSWQIVQDLSVGGWSHEDLMGMLWAGMLHDNPDITVHDAWAIWDATPIDDRTKAVTELAVVIVRALGANIDFEGQVHSKGSDIKKE